jgi:threonine synthase
MRFISTRNSSICQSLSSAMVSGLSSDGGLFIPEYSPPIDFKLFNSNTTLNLFSQNLLHPFFSGDALEKKLEKIIEKTLIFPFPLQKINANTFMLELFHGPTCSFKDIGARFLAECLTQIPQKNKTTIMVATSGDTGSAVASAFYLKQNLNVIILYPKGQISQRQQQQITCWDNNILALAVEGTFDHCQKLVKSAFLDVWWQKHMHLNSANSINIGRLLPQMIYYAYSSMQFYHCYQTSPGYIIPTGNLGNAVACFWAKKMGFPIREIALSTNANKTIPEYLVTGEYKARKSISTLANAMDVGNPSNFERLQALFNSFNAFKSEVKAVSVSDENIKNTIRTVYTNYLKIICPHTATAFFVRQQLSKQPWIIVATADPFKFDCMIEQIIDVKIPTPPQLQRLLNQPASSIQVISSLEEINKIIRLKNWSNAT